LLFHWRGVRLFTFFTGLPPRCSASWKPSKGRLGVQVVEGVGIVASGFQFFSSLAAVFNLGK